jgi:hypothetical protein
MFSKFVCFLTINFMFFSLLTSQMQSPLELLELTGNELVLEVYWSEPEDDLKCDHIVTMNCTDMQVVEGGFDAAISFNTLEWALQPSDICQMMLTSLNSNGKCLIVAMPQDSNYLCVLKEALKDPRLGWEEASLISDAALRIWDYQKIGKENQFRIVHSEIKREMMVFHSFEEMQDEAMKVAVTFLPEHLHAAILEIFAEHTEQYKAEDGLILIPFRTLILLLVRSD